MAVDSLAIHLHLKRLGWEEKLRRGQQFFAKYFDVGVKKQNKIKEEKLHVQLVPPAIGSVLHVFSPSCFPLSLGLN